MTSLPSIRDVVPPLGQKPFPREVFASFDTAPAFASALLHADRLRPFFTRPLSSGVNDRGR